MDFRTGTDVRRPANERGGRAPANRRIPPPPSHGNHRVEFLVGCAIFLDKIGINPSIKKLPALCLLELIPPDVSSKT